MTEHDTFALEPADPAPMPWWRTVTSREFAEMDGDVAVLNSERQVRGKEDLGWWQRSIRLQGFIKRKRKLVSCELTIRNDQGTERRKQKQAKLAALCEQARSGDVQEAVVGLLEYMQAYVAPHHTQGRRQAPPHESEDP